MTRTSLFGKLSLLVGLAGLTPLLGCGDGGAVNGGGFVSATGPIEMALPIFDDGALKTVVLRNFSGDDVTVSVRRSDGLGATAPVNLTIGALAEQRVAPGLLEGWVLVNTIDPLTGQAGPGTGQVEAFVHAERTGPDEEVCPAATFQRREAVLAIHPKTDGVLLLNHDDVVRTFTVCAFGTASGPPVSVVTYPVGPQASRRLNDFVALPGRIGHLSVLQEDAPFALAAVEDDDLVYDVDDRLNGTPRLLDAGAAAQATLVLGFGRDPQSGGYEDFDLVLSNATDDPSPRGVTLHSVHDEFGNALLTTPRTLTLGPRATRLLGTTLATSLGLEVGEVHPFADLFGDVFATTSHRRFHAELSISQGVVLRGRAFDPLVLEYAGRVLPTSRRTTTSVLVVDAQTTLLSGLSNVITLANPSSGPVTVQVRAFTAIEGTQYDLPTIILPARSLTDVRADALHLKETPGVPTLADVPSLRLLFSGSGPFVTSGRRAGRDTSNLLLFITPHLVRHDN